MPSQRHEHFWIAQTVPRRGVKIWRMEGKSWILINTLKGLHYSVEKKNNAYTLSGEGEGGGVAYNGKIIPGVSKLLLS